MVAVVERLEVAAEQIREVRKSLVSEGQTYRLDIAHQAIQSAIGLLDSPMLSPNGGTSTIDAQGDGVLSNVVWERPRKHQRFEAQLLKNGKIRLPDGRGPFSPSGACRALVNGEFDGWREWKYWDQGEEKWLRIGELRATGYFD